MSRAQALLARLDGLQQHRPVLGFPFAVVRKFSDDQASSKAVLIAYNGLFALFPLLLLLSTVLGFVLRGDPHLRAQVLDSAVAKLPVLGSQLKAHSLRGSGLALGIGVAGLLYGTQGVGQAGLGAMNGLWNVPYVDRPSSWHRRVRGLVALSAFGLSLVAATVLADLGHLFIHGPLSGTASLVGALAINLASFVVAFRILTSERLTTRDVLVGAALASVLWEILQVAGSLYVGHIVTHDSATYGFFAVVIGLMSFVYLGAQLTLVAAEVNVVRRDRLWPRSLTRTGLTAADRAVYERLARMETRRTGMTIEVRFDDDGKDDDGKAADS
jgi:YihY family inner membrane protein